VLNVSFLKANDLWETRVPPCLVHVRFGDKALKRKDGRFRGHSLICKKGVFDRACYQDVVDEMKTFCGNEFDFISDNSLLATFVENGTVDSLRSNQIKHFADAVKNLSFANKVVRQSLLDWLRLIRSPRKMAIPQKLEPNRGNPSTFFLSSLFINSTERPVNPTGRPASSTIESIHVSSTIETIREEEMLNGRIP
jgi:hypothetical protein